MHKIGLISGDLHAGQFYESDCVEQTGVNVLFEVTSSGLSFYSESYSEKDIDCFEASPLYHGVNYGLFEIPLIQPSND